MTDESVSITELQPRPRVDGVYVRIGKSIHHDGSISDYPSGHGGGSA